jgi:hypothetical protein
VAIFRLDYLSCFLTVVATVLVGRKMWSGLVVSGVNSLVVCVIGLHTSQYGFIPANVFCICINAFSLRAWLKTREDSSESTTDANSEVLAGRKPMSTHRLGSVTARVSPSSICILQKAYREDHLGLVRVRFHRASRRTGIHDDQRAIQLHATTR